MVWIQVPGRFENPVAGFMSKLESSKLNYGKAENENSESESKLPPDHVIDVQVMLNLFAEKSGPVFQ